MHKPRLKDSKKRTGKELYPLGELPDTYIIEISKWMTYHYATGKQDITGTDWGDIFAKSISGNHLASPVGLADITFEQQCWSSKTVHTKNPHSCKKIRIISGRNSPDYSYGIQNPHEDPQKTGTAVLGIWNERVNIALDHHSSLRNIILVRNFNNLTFTIFEEDVKRFTTSEYEWKVNKSGNLEGYDLTTKQHKFTWQPHGSQFTIMYAVPDSSIKFRIKKPKVFDFEKTIQQIGFDKSWVEII